MNTFKYVASLTLTLSLGALPGCSALNKVTGDTVKSQKDKLSNETAEAEAESKSPSKTGGDSDESGSGFPTAATDSVKKSVPLEPVEDDGIVNDVHKKYLGKVVFTQSAEDLALNSEKPENFTNSFALSDPIFFRTYFKKSLQNAFRAQGVKCHRSGDKWAIYNMSIDGKPVGEKGHIYYSSLGDKAYSRFTTMRFMEPINGKVEQDTKNFARDFIEKVVPELTPGTHKIGLELTGRCMARNQGNEDRYLDSPLASGEFTLEVTEDALANLVSENGAQMPAASMEDKELTDKMAKIMEREWPKDEILKVNIVNEDWSVIRNKVTGIITGRTISTAVATKQDSGKCRVFDVGFAQEAQGGGKFSNTRFNGVGRNTIVPCGNIPR